MSFKSFLKDRITYIILILFASITSQILLLPSEIAIFVRIYVGLAPIILFLIYFFIEYYKKKNYYNNLKESMMELSEKYLIAEITGNPGFEEGKILKEIVQETGKSMLENVDKYKYLQEDYKEYIELWIHEIKLPIAAGKMIIENNKSEVTESINEELDKIENYIEQALFYARSNTVEKDYYIKKANLKEIVNSSIIKNKRNLIQNKINIDAHDINTIVYTDHKWCMFILSQIIQNAVKYSKEDSKKIEIYSEIKKENTILYIKDNGIGIRKGEITRVFEKGFTGENGRKRGQKATGIGLYLCKKLCNKLGLGLELNSEKDVGTEVKIVFPKSSFISETF